MDYVYAYAIKSNPECSRIVSYDISCQWSKHLLERLAVLPEHLRPPPTLRPEEFVIPKFHIAAHNMDCQCRFSLHFTEGVGQTDGEGIERNWARVGMLGITTKEMGPGARHDVLDDHWGHNNWSRTKDMGE